jgi:hypothetical protein
MTAGDTICRMTLVQWSHNLSPSYSSESGLVDAAFESLGSPTRRLTRWLAMTNTLKRMGDP